MTGMEWALIGSMILPYITNLLGGGKKQATQTTETTQQVPQPYVSPLKYLMEPYLLQGMTGNFDLFKNFGLPKGVSGGLGLGDWNTLLGPFLQQSFEQILAEMANPSKTSKISLLGGGGPSAFRGDELKRRSVTPSNLGVGRG